MNQKKLIIAAFLAGVVAFQAHGQGAFSVATIDQRVAALEEHQKKTDARLDNIEAKCTCLRGLASPAGTTTSPAKCELVTHADGSTWVRCCDQAGCREYRTDSANAGGVMYASSGGCVSCGMSGGSGGDCASGDCGGGMSRREARRARRGR